MNDLKGYIIKHETPRMELRTLKASDVSADYVRWLQDPEVLKYVEVRHHKQDHKTISDFVGKMFDSSNDLMLGMFLKEGGKHIGNIKIGPVNWQYGRGEVGIIIGDKDSWGKGYATEAIEGVCDIGFKTLKLRRLQAGAYEGNMGSVKAFERAGFRQEGVWREYWMLDGTPTDQICMGKLAGDP